MRKVKRSGQTFVPVRRIQSFPEDARAVMVESQYDEMEEVLTDQLLSWELLNQLALCGRICVP